MLTFIEKRNTAKEMQENYKRLNQDIAVTLKDLQISEQELMSVLTMKSGNPGHCWMVRDYLEDKLKEKGIEIYPFSRLGDHSANKWYFYETPWRD